MYVCTYVYRFFRYNKGELSVTSMDKRLVQGNGKRD